MLSYESLRIIWWLLLGVLLVGIAIMDGFDLGIGMLLHRVAKDDQERRVVLNTIGPVWEGNQVWLILGGGAIFAAWPSLYAISFSGFYLAMLLVLLGLILRPVGFKYRSKISNVRWRRCWDFALFAGGFLPALIFGVAIGNVLQGVPFHFDEMLRGFYTGRFGALLNPFALLCGLVSIAMLTMHGGTFLCIKTTGLIQRRASRYIIIASLCVFILFAVAGLWIDYGIKGYVLMSSLSHYGPSNPLQKAVSTELGGWLLNYKYYRWLWLVPAMGFIGATSTLMLSIIQYYRLAFITSAVCIASIITTVGVSMFPFILPSSTHPNMSLMVWDASSSQTTLFIMLLVTAVFIPIIITYTSWVYYVLRGKVTTEHIQHNSHHLY